jgi:hypothetical protein
LCSIFWHLAKLVIENNNNRLASQPLNRLHRTQKTPRGITAVNITSGNDEGDEKQPRWSVIRDVLHWVE